MGMRLFSTILLTTGCGITAAEDAFVQADPTPVSEAMRILDPGPLVDLVHRPADSIRVGEDCPQVVTLDAGLNATHERWLGDCMTDDGAAVFGTLERFDGPNLAWITGTEFRVEQSGETVFALDGAVELTDVDALWLMDVSVSICGLADWQCADGMIGMDLTSSLFPSSGFPDDYDATVSGAIATDRSTMTVDGAWSMNANFCAIEPTQGALTIRHGDLHVLTLDGAQDCDACGLWEVQGQPMPELCGPNR